MIRIQREAFDAGAAYAELAAGRGDIGAVAMFVGQTRGSSGGRALLHMTLEHYPALAQRELAHMEREARAQWPLAACLMVHRYGELHPGAPIVLVLTAAAHRDAAFAACRFLVEQLKTRAPFWKLEAGADGAEWVLPGGEGVLPGGEWVSPGAEPPQAAARGRTRDR